MEGNQDFTYYQDLFHPLDPNVGMVLEADSVGCPGKERGPRQHWLHKIKYYSVKEHEFLMKCICLIIKLGEDNRVYAGINSICSSSRF